MTSQINPADIDANYPIAGVSNNTQGMRDNFTYTQTNFQYAAQEITDLQSKSVLKAALTGTTLDNNLANNLIYNAQIRGISGTAVAIANTSGIITIDCSAGHYQSINMAGNVSLSFTSNTWPASGTAGMVRTQITVDQVGRTLTLPGAVSNGITGIQGYSSNVITFANTGTYEFGFLTTNAGNAITMFDLNRPLNYYTNGVNIAANTNATSTTSGALIVAGGIGVAGNLYVGGDIFGNVTVTDISVGTITAAGNVVGGNINTAGLITATGNVTGGNLNTGGLVSATGNVIGGNLRSTSLSLSGNIISALNASSTIVAGTTISAIGNIIGGNLNAAGLSLSGNVVSALNVTANIAGGNLLSPGMIKSSSSTAGIGYATGAGTTVTQTVSRTQGVQIDRVTGQITLFTASGTSAYTTFVVTNSTVVSGDVIILSQKSGTDKYLAFVTNVTNGTFSITFSDVSGTTSEAPVFNFAVIKAVAA
jgi:hypothetical protein